MTQRAVAATRFDAFLSYSHASDNDLAPALREGLQRIAKPWFRRRAARVFLDTATMSTDPALWTAITRSIDASKTFVLLMSPQSASSTWVNREIEYWIGLHGVDRLLPILTSGELRWDASAQQFADGPDSAAPPALRHAFSEEPRFLDLRWAHATPARATIGDPQFRDAVAELAAPMRGVEKDDLVGSDLREHRRTRRLVQSVVLVLIGLLAVAVVAAVAARRNARNAERRRIDAQAVRLRLESTSPALVPDLRFLLAAEANRLRAGDAGSAALFTAAQLAPDLRRLVKPHNAPVVGLAFDRRSKVLVSYDRTGTVVATEPITGKVLATARFERNGAAVVATDAGIVVVGLSKATLIDPQTLRKRREWWVAKQPFAGAVASGDELFLLRLDGKIARTSLTDDTGESAPTLTWKTLFSTAILGAAVAPDGDIVAVGSAAQVHEVIRFSLGEGEITERWRTSLPARPNAVAVSADGEKVGVGMGARLFVVNADGTAVGQVPLDASVIALAASSDPTYWLAAMSDGSVLYFQIANGVTFAEVLHDGPASALAWAPDGSYASGDENGRIALATSTANRVTGGASVMIDATALTVRPDGQSALAISADGELREVQLRFGNSRSSMSSKVLASVPDGDALSELDDAVVVGLRSGGFVVLRDGKAVASADTGASQAIASLTTVGAHTIVTLTANGRLQSWRFRDDILTLVRTLSDRASAATTVAFDGGVRIAFVESTAGIVVANALTGGEERRIPLSFSPTVMAMAPDGRQLSVANGSTILRFDLVDRTDDPDIARSAALSTVGEVTALAYVDNGRRLVVAGVNATVRVMNAQTGAVVGVYADDERERTRVMATNGTSGRVLLATGSTVRTITARTSSPSDV